MSNRRKPQAQRLRHVVSVRINDTEKMILKMHVHGKTTKMSDILRIVLDDWIQQRDMRQAA